MLIFPAYHRLSRQSIYYIYDEQRENAHHPEIILWACIQAQVTQTHKTLFKAPRIKVRPRG